MEKQVNMKKFQPLVSVIVPVYNKAKYIPNILLQIQTQSFWGFECILIDDGSTDGSGEICDRFAAQDPRFRVFHIPNGGVSHARNVGLDAATGDYITFIDSDDGVSPDYLENLVHCVTASKADLVISGFEKVDAEGRVIQKVFLQNNGTLRFQEQLPSFAKEQMESGIYGCCAAKLFRNNLVAGLRFDETLKLAEDFDFYLNLYERIETIYLDDCTYYQYLQDAENSTGNTASENIDYLAQLRINLHYRDMLQKRGAFDGENRRIVEDRLSSYAFFVLFHTPIEHYREHFDALYEIYRKQNISLNSNKQLGRWLFLCLCQRKCTMARETMRLYRIARNIRKVFR